MPGPKARKEHVKFPLLGRVPWFREPFKVVEPITGSFLKASLVFWPKAWLGHRDYRYLLKLLGFCRLYGQSTFALYFFFTWLSGPLFSAVPQPMLPVELEAQGLQAARQVRIVQNLCVLMLQDSLSCQA